MVHEVLVPVGTHGNTARHTGSTICPCAVVDVIEVFVSRRFPTGAENQAVAAWRFVGNGKVRFEESAKVFCSQWSS